MEFLSETNICVLKITILWLAHLFFHVHCCGSTEAVIRLDVSAFVGVAAVAFPIYDIRATETPSKICCDISWSFVKMNIYSYQRKQEV